MTTSLIPEPNIENACANSDSVAYVASQIIKAAPGMLYRLVGYNSKGTAQFIQLHDAAALPADAAVPKEVITVATVGNFAIDFGPYGRKFTAGIVVCNSSTGPTKTIGSADCWFSAQYK